MNGVHDMGGMDGFGKVEPERNEPVFHEAWEGRVMAMNRAMGATGMWNIDVRRFSREMLPPHVYLASSYYRKWFLGLEQMLLERGLVDADEIAAGHALRPGKPLKRGKFDVAAVDRVMTRGSFSRPAPAPARFKPGDRVGAQNIHPVCPARVEGYVGGYYSMGERAAGA